MNLIITGCEYAGTTTFAKAIGSWMRSAMGGIQEIHDHFKLPDIACYRLGRPAEPLNNQELEQILGWTPKLQEMAQRQSLMCHMPNTSTADDYILVDYHIGDAVYGPRFFGYGQEHELQGGQRSKYARRTEKHLLDQAPDTILVTITASLDAISTRMASKPHSYAIVQSKDVEPVLAAFTQEHENSIIPNKIMIDSTDTTVEEMVATFRSSMQPFLSIQDRRRLAMLKN
jgi:hypothetical protein|tara:strand:- start:12 stop:698 length:687 start_codon:yes stop_codon:yes gene_type:complete